MAPVPPPNTARMQANRAAFLTTGIVMATPLSHPPRPTLWRRLAGQIAACTALLLVALFLFFSVSATSLPGERLYLAKLASEQLVGWVQDDAAWAERVEQQRRAEVLALLETGREAEVDFAGALMPAADGQWQIGGIPLELAAEQQTLAARTCSGSSVRVRGTVAAGEFHLSHLTPSCVNIGEVSHAAALPPAAPLVMPDAATR